MVNQNFSQQILKKSGRKDMALPNPFYDEEDSKRTEAAGVAYRYRKFALDDKTTLVCRTELHGLVKKQHYMTAFALNEYNPTPNNPQAVNWREKIDSQRGAVLEYFCDRGNASAILRLFRGMRNSVGVHLDADTYAMILGSLARHGWFDPDAEAIDGQNAAGFTASHGPGLLDEIASEMSTDLLELTEASATKMEEAFRAGFENSSTSLLCKDPTIDARRNDVDTD